MWLLLQLSFVAAQCEFLSFVASPMITVTQNCVAQIYCFVATNCFPSQRKCEKLCLCWEIIISWTREWNNGQTQMCTKGQQQSYLQTPLSLSLSFPPLPCFVVKVKSCKEPQNASFSCTNEIRDLYLDLPQSSVHFKREKNSNWMRLDWAKKKINCAPLDCSEHKSYKMRSWYL